jgi:hypothetical protein
MGRSKEEEEEEDVQFTTFVAHTCGGSNEAQIN